MSCQTGAVKPLRKVYDIYIILNVCYAISTNLMVLRLLYLFKLVFGLMHTNFIKEIIALSGLKFCHLTHISIIFVAPPE